jgi:hypothetical protein
VLADGRGDYAEGDVLVKLQELGTFLKPYDHIREVREFRQFVGFLERCGYTLDEPDLDRKYDFWLSGKMEENRIRAHERARGRAEERIGIFRDMYKDRVSQKYIKDAAQKCGMSEREIQEMFKTFQTESPAAPQVEAPKPSGMQM